MIRNPNRPQTQRKAKAAAARYTKFVEWSDEDGCFIGRCPEIMSGGIHGHDEVKVFAELCQAVAEMIALMLSDQRGLPTPVGGLIKR